MNPWNDTIAEDVLRYYTDGGVRLSGLTREQKILRFLRDCLARIAREQCHHDPARVVYEARGLDVNSDLLSDILQMWRHVSKNPDETKREELRRTTTLRLYEAYKTRFLCEPPIITDWREYAQRREKDPLWSMGPAPSLHAHFELFL